MKLCIPAKTDAGLEAPLSSHFGHAPFFTVVDSESGAWEAVANGKDDGAHHGGCWSVEPLAERGVEAVICGGLGRGAFQRLGKAGMEVYWTDEANVQGAVKAFREGRLRRLTAPEGCGCHDHGHGRHHGRRAGGGHGHLQGGHEHHDDGPGADHQRHQTASPQGTASARPVPLRPSR